MKAHATVAAVCGEIPRSATNGDGASAASLLSTAQNLVACWRISLPDAERLTDEAYVWQISMREILGLLELAQEQFEVEYVLYGPEAMAARAATSLARTLESALWNAMENPGVGADPGHLAATASLAETNLARAIGALEGCRATVAAALQ